MGIEVHLLEMRYKEFLLDIQPPFFIYSTHSKASFQQNQKRQEIIDDGTMEPQVTVSITAVRG
jgi:hypothetical protein